MSNEQTGTEKAITEQVNGYFRAVYGNDYVYRAPEMFPPVERWMLAIGAGQVEWAGMVMEKIIAVRTAVSE